MNKQKWQECGQIHGESLRSVMNQVVNRFLALSEHYSLQGILFKQYKVFFIIQDTSIPAPHVVKHLVGYRFKVRSDTGQVLCQRISNMASQLPNNSIIQTWRQSNDVFNMRSAYFDLQALIVFYEIKKRQLEKELSSKQQRHFVSVLHTKEMSGFKLKMMGSSLPDAEYLGVVEFLYLYNDKKAMVRFCRKGEMVEKLVPLKNLRFLG